MSASLTRGGSPVEGIGPLTRDRRRSEVGRVNHHHTPSQLVYERGVITMFSDKLIKAYQRKDTPGGKEGSLLRVREPVRMTEDFEPELKRAKVLNQATQCLGIH